MKAKITLHSKLTIYEGAMIYVVVREMLPEAMSLSSVNVATLGFLIGFMLLMSLDGNHEITVITVVNFSDDYY